MWHWRVEGVLKYISSCDNSLSPKLGAAKHCVAGNEDVEDDCGDVNYLNIQGQSVGDYSKIKDAQKHSVIFDLMEVSEK